MESLDTILKAASGLGGGGFLAAVVILYKTGILSKLNSPNEMTQKLDTYHEENTARFNKIDNCLSNIKDKVGKHEVEIAVIKALQNHE